MWSNCPTRTTEVGRGSEVSGDPWARAGSVQVLAASEKVRAAGRPDRVPAALVALALIRYSSRVATRVVIAVDAAAPRWLDRCSSDATRSGVPRGDERADTS